MNRTFIAVDGQDIASDDARLDGLDAAFQAAWRIDGPGVITTDLATAKAIKKSQVSAKRYDIETGGMTVSGAAVSTDRDSQGLVTGAAFAASLNSEYTVQWKTASGFINLDATAIIGLAQAMRAHVQAAFDREATLEGLIDDAADLSALNAIDINSGWEA